MSTNGEEKATDANTKEAEDTEQVVGPSDAEFDSGYVNPARRLSDDGGWISKRSRYVNRCRPEDLNRRIEFYDRLKDILDSDSLPRVGSKQGSVEAHRLENDNTRSTSEAPLDASESSKLPSHVVTDGSERSAQCVKVSTPRNTDNTVEVSPSDLLNDSVNNDSLVRVETHHIDDSLSAESTYAETEHEWQLAEKFNCSLGMEMARFRAEIKQILSEYKTGILFPVELMVAYHLKFGRPINNCVQEFSFEELYAWLRCFSSLDISKLIL